MKTKLLSIVLTLSLALGLMAGCTVTAELPEGYDTTGTSTAVVFQENGTVSISGAGAVLDGGEVVIAEAGVYELSGVSANSRVIVKADDTADVTLVLNGLDLTNPLDEAIYFKTCGSASVILMPGTENILTSGDGSTPEETLSITDENEDASGAALRALCAMTVSGEGALTVNGYINNGIAADGGLTVTSGTYTVTAVNDGLKSDGDVVITGGTLDIRTDCDGVQAGNELIVTGGEINVLTGAGAEGAEMKVSDSLMMGNMGGGGDRNSRDNRSSSEASSEASTEAAGETEETASVWTNTVTGEEVASAAEETASSSSREMGDRGMGGFDDMMDFWDYDSDDTPSRKGLKAGTAMIFSGGTITVNAEDDAIHCDGSVTITGGKFTLSSGDDGIHGETTLDIAGGETYILLCYEGLEATAILISDGYLNITATDDGMNANGGMGMMGGMGGNRSSSQEASAESEETTADTASGEADTTADTASDEADTTASQEAGTETLETIVRISGGTVIVNSGGDGLDSNASLYIEGGTIFVSGPSSNWDSPIDYGEGSSEFVISGGFLMAAGYSGMFESPDTTDASQSSIYYIQSGYAPDNAVTTLTDASGNVLAEYAFANSYNGVLISTPEMAAGETYTLTIDGVDTVIEMTTAQYNSRGSSGEMGMMGGRGGRG